MYPFKAAAAAVMGLANMVLAPGPCRPSKLRLEVETASLPSGILSSFMAKHAEQPGCLKVKPASVRISTNLLHRPFFLLLWIREQSKQPLDRFSFYLLQIVLQLEGLRFDHWYNCPQKRNLQRFL